MNAPTREFTAHRAQTSAAPSPEVSERDYTGETYYGMPAVKPAPFKRHVSAYLFVSGLAGGAQLIASVARCFGPSRLKSTVRNGRLLALAGAAVGPALLVADLKTPRRWYNMLRIFRRTSPMSIGTYIVSAFGLTSAAGGLSELLRGRSQTLPAAVEVPAMVSGAAMCTYTGAILASTSTPFWAAQSPLLGARAGTSGLASAAAALALAETLAGRDANGATLERFGIVATLTYAAVSACADQQVHAAHVATPLETPPLRSLDRTAKALAIGIPIACEALKALGIGRSRALSVVSALGTLAGAGLSRYVELEAGKASPKIPQDYLRYTRAEERA